MPKINRAALFIIIGVILLKGLTLAYSHTSFFNFNNNSVKTPIVKKVVVIKKKIAVTPTVTPTPSPTPIVLSKKTYVIAAYGDSMIDTMGENLEYLSQALKIKYPGVAFKLYNYGIGSQNVEMGLARWNSAFTNRERSYPAITAINADVIILGSFSYNPFFPHDANKHYLLLTQLVQKAKETGAAVYLLAEIAPLYDGFGQGPHGPNMAIDAAHDQSNRILEQLESVAGLASSQGVGLIDAFTPTQVNGKYGSLLYINSDDGIHPSATGHEFVAEKIVETIHLK